LIQHQRRISNEKLSDSLLNRLIEMPCGERIRDSEPSF
jgi:hypothetical protein